MIYITIWPIEECSVAFYTSSSTTHGGSWERMIGTVKRALKSVMTGRRMNEETLSTVFDEVERINCRPLTHVSDNPLESHTQPFPDWCARSHRIPGVFGDDECDWRRR
jgi:hypothetical protein